MPRWKPVETWKDRDVFIIGGGDSLKGFDWSLLKNECTIGCNSAFILGSETCKICFFGDSKWFRKFHIELTKFDGLVFTSHRDYAYRKDDWIWYVQRQAKGLSKTKLGWNKNTGASAINLALILGAKNVYLLGFDMKLSPSGRPNWHDKVIDKPDNEIYKKFCKACVQVAQDLPVKFPGRNVVNINDSSNLAVFPKISVSEFWNNRVSEGLRKAKNG